MKCPAHCCRAFSISIPYETLREKYREWRDSPGGYAVADIHLIFPMLIPLGEFTEHPLVGVPLGRPTQLYACKHLGEDRLCTIYEDRPAMCREHPTEDTCTFGCGHPAEERVGHTYPPDPPSGLRVLKG